MSSYKKVAPEILNKLKKIAGEENVFIDEVTLKLCSKDETEDFSFAPEAVVKPSNTNQVSEILKLANENLPAGKYSIDFNAADLTSGIYFYRINSGSFSETKKMILTK